MNSTEKLAQLWRRLWRRLWPCLSKETECPDQVKVGGIRQNLSGEVDGSTIESIYEVAQSIAVAERERLDGITTKTFTLFGATGIISAVVLGLGRIILFQAAAIALAFLVVICLAYVMMLIYLLRCARYCLRVMDMAKFYILDPKDASDVQGRDRADYLKKLAITVLEHTERNYRVTNQKIDSFAVARECFLLGITLLVLLGMLLGAYSVAMKVFN